MYLGCGCIFMTFDFTTQMTSIHLLPHVNEQRSLSAKTTKYILQNVDKDLEKGSLISVSPES